MHQLSTRFDLTLDLVHHVAWAGGTLALAPEARARIAQRRNEFLALLKNDAGHGVYGVNQGQGEMIQYRMTEAQMQRLARLKPFPAAVSFGEHYPDRVTRAMVLARFANILHGHAAATPRLADALVEMLNHGPMPKVAATGAGRGGGDSRHLSALRRALEEVRSRIRRARRAHQRRAMRRRARRRHRHCRPSAPDVGGGGPGAGDRSLRRPARAISTLRSVSSGAGRTTRRPLQN